MFGAGFDPLAARTGLKSNKSPASSPLQSATKPKTTKTASSGNALFLFF